MIPSVNIVNILLLVSIVTVATGVAPVGFKSLVKCRGYQTRYNDLQQPVYNDFVFPDQILPKPKLKLLEGSSKFPFLALIIMEKPGNHCGGTLISEKFVLTAGSCASSKFQPIFVVFHAKTFNLTDDIVRYAINKTIKHPGYKSSPVYNDIGLIQLEKSVQFHDGLRPACLQVSKNIKNKDWVVNMWQGESELEFMSIKAEEIPEDKCQENYSFYTRISPYGVIAHLQMCVLEIKHSSRADTTEAPTPLITTNKNNNGYIVIGIPSTGLPGLPQVYTRVSSYIGWIESQVWPNDPVVGCNKYQWQN